MIQALNGNVYIKAGRKLFITISAILLLLALILKETSLFIKNN